MIIVAPGWALACVVGLILFGASAAMIALKPGEGETKVFGLPMLAISILLLYVGVTGCVSSAFVAA